MVALNVFVIGMKNNTEADGERERNMWEPRAGKRRRVSTT
jgi:hypothetical protein